MSRQDGIDEAKASVTAPRTFDTCNGYERSRNIQPALPVPISHMVCKVKERDRARKSCSGGDEGEEMKNTVALYKVTWSSWHDI